MKRETIIKELNELLKLTQSTIQEIRDIDHITQHNTYFKLFKLSSHQTGTDKVIAELGDRYQTTYNILTSPNKTKKQNLEQLHQMEIDMTNILSEMNDLMITELNSTYQKL